VPLAYAELVGRSNVRSFALSGGCIRADRWLKSAESCKIFYSDPFETAIPKGAKFNVFGTTV
jgi:hypothetical protein